MSGPQHAASRQFQWYLAGAGSWFFAFGIQAVMFSYLVTTVLHAPANQIGLAQASLTLISTALLLVGGALADQVDTRRLLMICHAMAILPAIVLAGVVSYGILRFEWLLVYGIAMGTVTAFILPAREAMLGDVLGPNGMQAVQRAVTTVVGATFMAQIGGMFSARFAVVAGPESIILLQAVAQAFGVYATYRLAPSHRHHTHAEENAGSQFSRILAGLRQVWKSEALLPITIITLSIGVLYIGSFLVILPVILREEFGGNVQQFSSMQVSFWGGSIISSLAISRFGTIARRGRLIVFAVSTGATILALISFKSSIEVLYLLIFVWGLGAGVMISMSRTTVQEHAPPALRARIMSIFQLGFTGGMSIGALLMGYVVEALGPRHATLVPAGIMAVILTALMLRTKVWHITSLSHAKETGSA